MKHGSNENKDIRAVCSRPREEVIILDDKYGDSEISFGMRIQLSGIKYG